MKELFVYNERLGIFIPSLIKEWDKYDKTIQHKILLHWDHIRGSIPDRIKALEIIINQKQDELSNENDFAQSCVLNSEIAELASIINDLWLLFRLNQNMSNSGEKTHT